MIIAVIPARGGSKRIPRKNIKMFCGKPMIAWSIEAALASGCFDKVVVSTDDPEIALVAQEWGADTPFLRPANLADDFTGTIPVIAHAIDEMRKKGHTVEFACCIYATAPFVQVQDIQHGLAELRVSDASYSFTVTSFPFPIQRAIRITDTGRLEMFHPELFNTRSQDLEESFHDAGQFYWGRTAAWLGGEIFFGPHSLPIHLPRARVQDIDTQEDWERAEWIFRAMRAAE